MSSDDVFKPLTDQIKDAIKNATRTDKSLINRNVKELKEAWEKRDKKEVMSLAQEIKQHIEKIYGSHYSDLTGKLKNLHKRIPEQNGPPRTPVKRVRVKSSQPVAGNANLKQQQDHSDEKGKMKLPLGVVKPSLNKRQNKSDEKGKRDESHEAAMIYRELSAIRDILSTEASAPAHDVPSILIEIRTSSKYITEENTKLKTDRDAINEKVLRLEKVLEEDTLNETTQTEGEWTHVSKKLDQMIKRANEDKKNLGTDINQLENQVKELEKMKNIQTEKKDNAMTTNASRLTRLQSKLSSLKKIEEDASKTTTKVDSAKTLKALTENVNKVWSVCFKNELFGNDSNPSNEQTDTVKMLLQIQKKVTDDTKNLSKVINQLENDVREWENARKLRPQEIENKQTATTGVSKLKQIQTKLTYLRNTEEAVS